MTQGDKAKVTFQNHVRQGTLHGEVTEVTPYEITLVQFTSDNLQTHIKRRQVIGYEIINEIDINKIIL